MGCWRAVLCLFCVMRVMSFVIGECVLLFIVYKCVDGSIDLCIAGGEVDDLDG